MDLTDEELKVLDPAIVHDFLLVKGWRVQMVDATGLTFYHLGGGYYDRSVVWMRPEKGLKGGFLKHLRYILRMLANADETYGIRYLMSRRRNRTPRQYYEEMVDFAKYREAGAIEVVEM